MSKLVGQRIFTGIRGHALTEEEKTFIAENNIGGVVLFARNVAEPQQVRDLCAEIQSLRHLQADKAPLFIGIDMEGGRVHRLKAPFTLWPAVARLGKLDNPTTSFDFAHRMGNELKAVGINLDFAPCVDVLTNPQNKVIGDRAISTEVAMVDKHASAMVRGYIKSGIICCPKHFPGHGNTLVDSHEDLPVETADRKRLEDLELIPFKKSFKSGADMVMAAHIRYPRIDQKYPASLSATFLTQILRTELRYRGLIITDDLGMGALTKHFTREEIAVRAIEAGADLLLYCNEFDAPPAALEAIIEAMAQGRLSKLKMDDARARILTVKRERLQNPDPLPWEQMSAMINTPANQTLVSTILLKTQ